MPTTKEYADMAVIANSQSKIVTLINDEIVLKESMNDSERLETYRSQKLSELRKKLDDSDYYQSKMIDGAMSAEEYEPFKIRRASWRSAFNAVQVAASIDDINTIMEGSVE